MQGDDEHDSLIGNNDGEKVNGNNNIDGYGDSDDIYMDSYRDCSTDGDGNGDDNDTNFDSDVNNEDDYGMEGDNNMEGDDVEEAQMPTKVAKA
ncbi:hypothetical protein CASFOL_017829 [Castilleja foliolosa]|uniref:Uncharacterized protein n=1 Tax=Castilleja foliolosa TaxID=1961234 RepID=A0ABD3D812_9LAMI